MSLHNIFAKYLVKIFKSECKREAKKKTNKATKKERKRKIPNKTADIRIKQ